MIDIPTPTAELLTEIGEEFGGYDFKDLNQIDFLKCTTSCDVQAAPGNGKTTLLIAKLALLSRNWNRHTQGVCVISHTNTAKEEVEKMLASHPTAFIFLSYPHFIGTVTAFINRFIALPYLRGLGWNIERIDDKFFEDAILSKWHKKSVLVSYAKKKPSLKSNFISNLELDPDFECIPHTIPEKLKIRHRKGQPRPGKDKPTGNALEELKAEMVNAGIYRFGDMTALAIQALKKCPELANHIRARFPLVLLDEAQDTNGAQLLLLNQLFEKNVAYQRLGDPNQTLYEDSELSKTDYWQPSEEAIPLNSTRRFGSKIANFASGLTVRNNQKIEGKPDEPGRCSLLLFDQNSIGSVLHAYKDEVLAYWGDRLTTDHDIWAVASRHKPTRDTSGEWPKSLAHYYPSYRNGNSTSQKLNTLCGMLKQASIAHREHKSPSEVMEFITAGIVKLLHLYGHDRILEKKPTCSNFRSLLTAKNPAMFLELRCLLWDSILVGNSVWEQNAWNSFCITLKRILNIPHTGLNQLVVDFLQFDPQELTESNEKSRCNEACIDDVIIKLGSIHSLKGRTVDAILVLESEVFKENKLSQRAMDLTVTLPHAFGINTIDFLNSENKAHLAAATNIFVASTRPRQLLCMAMRKSSASPELRKAAEKQGWIIRDLSETNT